MVTLANLHLSFRMRITLTFLTILYALIVSAQDVQWASRVLGYSSQYSEKSYSAAQALGPPSKLPATGASPTAWSPLFPDKGKEWIKVGFSRPTLARQVLIGENANPGAVVKITLTDDGGRSHVVYERSQPGRVSVPGRLWHVPVGNEGMKAIALEVELNTALVPGYNHIDCIGITSGTGTVEATIKLSDITFEERPENLGSQINSAFNEVHPVISPDGMTLYFTRKDHPENIGMEKRDDIWMARMGDDGQFNKAENLGPPLNNEGHNFLNAIMPDGNTAFVAGAYGNAHGKDRLYLSQRGAQGWGQPQEIKVRDYYNLSDFNSFHMGVDGRTILLAIERNDSYGFKDLHVSFLTPQGEWTAPMNLGPNVNSAGDEITPFLAADGKTLYFATNGRSGYGNSDIFVTRRLDDTWKRWTEPENLGPMVNSSDWDAYYTVPASGEFAYFSSYRSSLGEADIFRIPLEPGQKPEATVLIRGRVLDAKTRQPIGVDIRYTDTGNGLEAGQARSGNEDGKYQVVLPMDGTFDINGRKSGYYALSSLVDTRGLKAYEEREMDLLMYPVVKGEVIPLENIFFETNSANLLPTSHYELDRAANWLRVNPGIRVEVGGHTNNRCSSSYCLELSRDRAKSVAEYLKKKDVPAVQVLYKGYGKDKPIDSNDTEDGRKRNQRVEFTVLAVD